MNSRLSGYWWKHCRPWWPTSSNKLHIYALQISTKKQNNDTLTENRNPKVTTQLLSLLLWLLHLCFCCSWCTCVFWICKAVWICSSFNVSGLPPKTIESSLARYRHQEMTSCKTTTWSNDEVQTSLCLVADEKISKGKDILHCWCHNKESRLHSEGTRGS